MKPKLGLWGDSNISTERPKVVSDIKGKGMFQMKSGRKKLKGEATMKACLGP